MDKTCLLYYITDRAAFPGNERTRQRRVLDKIAEAAVCRVDYIQLREKDLSARELESLACEAIAIIRKLKTKDPEQKTAMLLNSRTDIALASHTDGVHLRSDDVSPEDVRIAWKLEGQACGAGALAREPSPREPVIGVSCHSPEEVAQAAANRATFAVFGPVFQKKDSTPVGLGILTHACRTNIPVFALGGVTVQNAVACLHAGAAGIAGIRLFQENDISAVVRALRSSYGDQT
jgi:thiamine-phosphate pyrophosphorylase